MMRGLSRKIISAGIVLFAVAVMAPWVANAQDDLRTASEVIKKQRQLYTQKIMELTPQESEAFWSLYAEYDSGLSKIRGERIKLATSFLQSHGNLSDAEALKMLTGKLRIDSDELKFKQAYVAKFMQVLPVRKVVRFYLALHRFDTSSNAELYRYVPLIR